MSVNKSGYLVNLDPPEGRRTYACATKRGLADLLSKHLERIVGMDEVDNLIDTKGKSMSRDGVSLAFPFHIYD